MTYRMLVPAALALAASTTAVAQPPMPPRQAPDPAQMIARRGDDLALLLGLRADQRPALDAMLRASAPPARPVPAQTAPDGPPPAESFADRLTRMEQEADRHAQADRARIAGTRAFYQALDGTQQKRFEALMRLGPGPAGGFGPPPPQPGGPVGAGGPKGFGGPGGEPPHPPR